MFVGKFADWKRLNCLLRAVQQYEKRMPAAGGRVVTLIVGSGPLESQKLYMMDLAIELQLQARTPSTPSRPRLVLSR